MIVIYLVNYGTTYYIQFHLLSFSVAFSIESDFESSIAATRVSRCWSLLVSLVDRDSTSWVASDGDWDLQRCQQVEGADEGDRTSILSRP